MTMNMVRQSRISAGRDMFRDSTHSPCTTLLFCPFAFFPYHALSTRSSMRITYIFVLGMLVEVWSRWYLTAS